MMIVFERVVEALIMRGSRKLCQRGSAFDNVFFFFFFFFFDEGKEDPNFAINE